MKRVVLVVVAAAGVVVHALAQTPAPSANLAFDVVSVKANPQGPGGPVFTRIQPGGRLDATNVPLSMLITQAYRIQPFQLIGAPAWVASDRFDISAKAPQGVELSPTPPGAPPGPQQTMMRAMLADRFKLKVHIEQRETPSYELVLARADGKLGPTLTRSETDCAAEVAAARARGAAPPPPPAFGQPMTCGMMMGPGSVNAGSVTLIQFATAISQQVGRTIVDRTGLTGNFNVMLTYTPDRMPQRPAGAPDGPVTVNGVPIDPNGPSLLAAIQEQLGLKLESSKTNMDVVVVDSVEHPTED
ncbi:MAG TPA: TIGR03435 family protein [Vicinamibacterales bacterium]|nr:TIGR03435 family protein [Vicinamibacterales bacterium]